MIGNAIPWRIAISGSASVGKTSLVSVLARALELNMLKEEMREHLESSRTDLSERPPAQVADVLIRLWRERQERGDRPEISLGHRLGKHLSR